MYTTCIFCHGDLHRNEAIEEFPVGRRLAFDGAKGRLWVVCRRCERWNLSPLETRWEAIEACERAFETTRMRVASDNIGLAKLKEGLELVRVGDPVRQEFAAWRYGDQFGRRRRRAMLIAGAGVTAVGALVAGGMLAGVSMGFVGSWGHMIGNWQRQRIVLRTRDEAGDPIRIQRKHLHTSRFVPGEDAAGWDLRVDHIPGWSKWDQTRKRKNQRHTMIVRGSEAIGLAGQLMARANHWGGARKSIQAAVARIETAGHPEAFLPQAAEMAFRDFRHSGKTNLSSKKIEKPVEADSRFACRTQGRRAAGDRDGDARAGRARGAGGRTEGTRGPVAGGGGDRPHRRQPVRPRERRQLHRRSAVPSRPAGPGHLSFRSGLRHTRTSTGLEPLSEKTLIVVGDRVLVEPLEGEDRTNVGLYLPPTAIDKQAVQSGTVVAVGPGTPVGPPAELGDEPWKIGAAEARYLPMQAQPGGLRPLLQEGRGRDHVRGHPVSRRPAGGDPHPRPGGSRGDDFGRVRPLVPLNTVRLVLVGLALSLLLVGLVSDTLLRHAIQVSPIVLVLILAPRWPREVGSWMAVGLCSFWLAVMVLIWLFLLGISQIADGRYTAVEVALTILIGGLCSLGIVRAVGEGRSGGWPRALLLVAASWAIQVGVMAVSFLDPVAGR